MNHLLLFNLLESVWVHTSAAMLDDKVWAILDGPQRRQPHPCH